MNIEKEREAFEALPQIKAILQGGNVYFSTLSMNYSSKNTDLEHCVYYINGAWYAWQAAKAQAVPDGLVLVNQKELMELAIAINAVDLATHTEGKPNEVRKMWQQVALKLGALCTAQESTND